MMEHQAFTDVVRSYIRQHPYCCFELELADRRVVTVHNPESIAFRHGRGVVIEPGGAVHQFTCESVVGVRPRNDTVGWMI